LKKNLKAAQQKPSWELKEELELAKCTFRPNTAKPAPKLPNSKKSVSGY